jgi:GNAT superfamily N-acetyltransferase
MMRDDGTQGVLHVREDIRRTGVAALLIEKLRQVLQAHGLHEVVGISNSNTPSRNLYVKHGFTEGERYDFVYLARKHSC